MEERIMAGYYDRDRRTRNPGGDDNFDTVHPAGTMNHAYSHHSNANEYLSSGVPFVYRTADYNTDTNTGGNNHDVTINFPLVTRWVMVNVFKSNNPATLVNNAVVGFSFTGDGTNAGDNAKTCGVSAYLCARQRLEVKCNQICVHLIGAAGAPTDIQIEVIAGLTGIKGTDFPDMDTTNVAGVTSKNTDGTTGIGGSLATVAFTIES